MIDTNKEIQEFYNMTPDEVNHHRKHIHFDAEWAEANIDTKEKANRFYADSKTLVLRQTIPRVKKEVLYRRILKDILTTTVDDGEFRGGKGFLDYTKQKVLDYGCGTGDIGLMLASVGYDVDFLEIGDSEFERFIKWRMEKRYLPHTFISYGEELKKNHYHVVVCYDVLEHHGKVRQALQDIYDSLKVGGYLFLEYGWHEREAYPVLGDLNADTEFIVPFLDKYFECIDGAKKFWFKKL